MPYCEDVDAVFLTIPSNDNGETALRYILPLLEAGITVITYEKSALAHNFKDLLPYIREGLLCYTASVGGGTGMLKYMKENLTSDTTRIEMILNGTTNFIFDDVSKGKSLEETVKTAINEGYAEPGKGDEIDPYKTIIAELDDIAKKTAIAANLVSFYSDGNDYISADDIEIKISNEELENIIKNGDMRYIVSITRNGSQTEEEGVGGFSFNLGEWTVSGGFRERGESALFPEADVCDVDGMAIPPKGVDNAMMLISGNGTNGKYVSGPGAGPEPTAGAMIKDLKDILQIPDESVEETPVSTGVPPYQASNGVVS